MSWPVLICRGLDFESFFYIALRVHLKKLIYPVVMAKGVHLFPSRTQKLSPYTSKVLGWKRPGRIDSCRLKKKHTLWYVSFLFTGKGSATCIAFSAFAFLRRFISSYSLSFNYYSNSYISQGLYRFSCLFLFRNSF